MRLQHRAGRRIRALLFVAVLSLLGGCSTCEGGVPLNLGLEVRDARTGAPAVYGATLTARQGSSVKTLDSVELYAPADSARLATFITDLQAGTYDLTITKPGYATWQKNGVQVRERGVFCSVPEQVNILAELQPLDGG